MQVLGARGLPREEFFAELGPRVRRVIPNTASCWHTLDPQTRLLTSDTPMDLIEQGIYTEETAPAAGEMIVRSEYMIDDYQSFAELAVRRVPVGILEHATRGRPELSTRYRELLVPSGIPHEMRAAFVIRGRVWGAVHMARTESSGGFTQRDADALAHVAGAIAEGIRASLRFDAARRVSGTNAPGLVLVDASNEVEVMTPPAAELVDALANNPDGYDGGVLPPAILSIAEFTRREDGLRSGGNVVTVPSSIGWITLHASRADPSDGRVAIVIERAAASQSASLRLETHGVTAREREVATLMARGLSNAEIATELVISPHTVQDHIKSLFQKVGVGSRQELVARAFLDDYLPDVIQRTPLTSRGNFDRAATDA